MTSSGEKKIIALSKAPLTDEHSRAAMRALESGWFILGDECKQFELELAKYFGVEHAVLCSNATTALTLTLLSWGVGPGDEVIVPSLTALPTAEAVYNAGATCVYADIDECFAMDPRHVERLITKALYSTFNRRVTLDDLDPIVEPGQGGGEFAGLPPSVVSVQYLNDDEKPTEPSGLK